MKNSASNPCSIKADIKQACEKQALQAQSQLLLPTITQALSVLRYREITHQRIGQQDSHQNNRVDANISIVYQGLTRAQHPQFGCVMIKWQLKADISQGSSDLTHEADVLTSISILSQNKNNFPAIAPPMLAYEELAVQMLAQSQQLTILVMPYYPNGSLGTQLNSRHHPSLTTPKKHCFIVESAHLIANLHNAGWLHNDIKPSNILLDGFLTNAADNSSTTSKLLLIDFALAESIDISSKANPVGTPAYFAPERWQGQDATQQSDIYAFGIMMTEILTGARPFKVNVKGRDPMIDWATQHCQQPVPKLPLEYSCYQKVVDKALAKRVQKRYQNMEEILRDLELLENR